jgi:phosphoglycolate phosphatase
MVILLSCEPELPLATATLPVSEKRSQNRRLNYGAKVPHASRKLSMELTIPHRPLIRLAMFSATSFRGLVEFSPSFAPRPSLTHVLFDFDGTLSLIREGWPEVMVPMFVEMLPAKAGESEAGRRQLAFEDIMRLNGKQTVYQMIQLAERIRERGGQPQDPLWYKKEYLDRLQQRIGSRKELIRHDPSRRDDFLVHGTRALLDELLQRGLVLYLASGTDETFVKEEAELLDLTRYFGRHIYGAQDHFKSFSKKMVIDRILQENSIPGAQLLSFGDGYVEIQNTKEAGGLAVAVASDEAHNGSGRMDAWKRERLLGVGADVVIPDYRDAPAILEIILGK